MPIIIWKRPHVRIPLEVVLLDSALLYVIGLTYKLSSRYLYSILLCQNDGVCVLPNAIRKNF
ncbi:hypothetical protein T01_12526, partial [Trichinella spiralis]